MADAHHSSRADFVRGASMQTANFVRLEFPANDGGERADEIGDASVNQQSRRVDLEGLALEAKLFAIVSDAGFIPFSAGTKIGITIRNAEEAFHSPPLRALLEIGDRFEDASWRSCNEDLRQDGIRILSESCGCHIFAFSCATVQFRLARRTLAASQERKSSQCCGPLQRRGCRQIRYASALRRCRCRGIRGPRKLW